MENRKVFYISIAIVAGIAAYLTYLVFKPFLRPIFLGIVFSIVFHPLYVKILDLTKGRKAAASLGTCLLIMLLIIIPLTLLTSSLVSEMASFYRTMEEAVRSGRYSELLPFLEWPAFQNLYQKLSRHLETYQVDLKETFLNALGYLSSYALQGVTGAVKNLLVFLLNILLMLFTMYYLLKDSDVVALKVGALIPLEEPQKERMFLRLKEIIHATLYGTVAAASAQGFLGGMAFWALGIGSPLLWGVTMGLLALLPMLGAFLIWFPASLILLVHGSYIKAAILLLWGSLVISMVDNLIRPLLMSGRAMLHPLVTFFSILGGIMAFGPVGLFVGPFAVALLLIFLEMIKEAEG